MTLRTQQPDRPEIATCSIAEYKNAIRTAVATRTPLIARAHPGAGKTQMARQLAREINFQYTEVVLRDVGDAYIPFVHSTDEQARLEFYYSRALPVVGNDAFDDRPVLLNLDEITTYSRLCQNLTLKILDEGAIADTHLRDDVYIVCTGNNLWDGAHVEQFSSALGNRGTNINFTSDYEFWMNYAIQNDFHPLVINWVRMDPTNLYDFDNKAHLAGDFAFPSERSNEKLSRIMLLHERQPLSDRLFRAEVCGTIGMARGTKYMSYVKIHDKLPDYDAILAGRPTKVPEDPSVLYASLYALIQRSTRDNLDNICKWIDTVPPEFHLLFTKLFVITKPSLLASAAWGKWLVEHNSTTLS